jgi:hypothetical protein
MVWDGGCHQRLDGRENNDPHLYLIHLHRMNYDICLARHHDRIRFPLARIDRDQGWSYQNQITDPATFSSWFFHDSCGPSPICPQPILWVPSRSSMSCDLGVFVDQSTEPVATSEAKVGR